MQKSEISQLTSKIIKIRDAAITVSFLYNETISKHDNLTEQTKKSFEESRRNLTLYAQNYKKTIGSRSATMLTKIDELIKVLEISEKNLYEFDKSFAKRKISLEASVISDVVNDIFGEEDDYLEKVNKTVAAMQKLTNECSLTKKAYPIQELSMIFSKKRFEMYKKLYLYICTAHSLRDEAYSLVPDVAKELWEKSIIERDEKIDEAAMETAQLLQDIAYKKESSIKELLENFEKEIDEKLIAELIITMQNFNENDDIIISDSFNEKIDIGMLISDFQGNILHQEVKQILEKKLGLLYEHEKIFIPIIIDISKGLNIFVYENQIEHTGTCMNLINQLMMLLLLNAPASKQQFVLFDPVGRGKGYRLFLELFNNIPELNTGQIWTTKEQMAKQLRKLSDFVDDVGQNKLAKYNDIYEYNNTIIENQETLKCLSILNFPKYFDERMLDDLYNIMTNGAKYGINVLLHYDDTQADKNSAKIMEWIENLQNISTLLENIGGNFFLNDSIMFAPHNKLAALENNDFINEFANEIDKVKKQGLSFNKIYDGVLFSKSCTDHLSIPIGKDGNGDIHSLRLGENSSHHCIIAGATGGGKSTLLHTIIMGALCNYSPDELNLYLMDFKSGTEFKVYSNYIIPHIKLLALDAMQEFGESILSDLLEEMNRRSLLFKENNSQNIQGYRENTKDTLPRILVLIDEFQILFDESNNRKAAVNCGNILSTLVMQGRSYGIHIILSTQTLRMADRRLSIQQSTLDQMLVRIGLKCNERESDYLFGSNGQEAFKKMRGELGAAVYSYNYSEDEGKQFKVAFCDVHTKNHLLKEISEYSQAFSSEGTRIFEGNVVPSIENSSYFALENDSEISNIEIHLGEPIRVAPPVVIHIDKRSRNNLLIVGTNEELTNRVVGLYMLSVLNKYDKSPISKIEKSVYYMDGNYIIDGTLSDFVLSLNERFGDNITILNSNSMTITTIDELYDIFTSRKKSRQNDQAAITVVINNLQWLDGIKTAFGGGNVSQYLDDNIEDTSSSTDDLFDFLGNTSALPSGRVNYKGKLLELLENGYTYGINFVITANDYLTIREYMSDVLSRIPKRIIHSISSVDADRLINGITTEGLNPNVVVYTDGIRNTYQFKPYAKPPAEWIEKL